MAYKWNPLVFAGLDLAGSGGAGPPGPAGAWTPRGEWKAATAYAVNDAVTWKGATYGCIKAMTAGEDKEPPNATFWEVLAEKGAAGATLTGKAPIEVAGTEIVLKPAGIIAEYLGPEAVTTAKIKDAAVTAPKLAEAAWEAVEALNAKLGKQGAPFSENISCVNIAGIVYVAGVVKITEEILSKGILFTLPVNCRPEKQQQALVGEGSSAGTHNLIVKTTGEVEAIAAIKITGTPLSLNFFFRKNG